MADQAAGGPRHEPDSGGGVMGMEGNRDNITMISFLTTHKTAHTWQRLKEELSLGDAQLAVLLLQCYENTVCPTACPECQSNLQQFCPNCSPMVYNPAAERRRSKRATSRTTVQTTGQSELSPSKSTMVTRSTRRRSQKNETEIKDELPECNDDEEVEETMSSADEKLETANDNTEDRNMSDDENNEENNVESDNSNYDSATDVENEDVDSDDKMNEDVNPENTESNDGTLKASSKEKKTVDIVSCMWCKMSFKTIVALSRHLHAHTTVSWQKQHLAKVTSRHKAALRKKTGITKVARNKSAEEMGEDSDTMEESVKNNSSESSSKLKYKCTQCLKSWKTPTGLTFHLQAMHLKKHAYKCLKCSSTFKSLRTIAAHMKTHPVKSMRWGDRDPLTHPHQCGQCGLRFMHAGVLSNHMEKHLEPSQVWCSQCQRPFQSLTELTGHQCQQSQDPAQVQTPANLDTNLAQDSMANLIQTQSQEVNVEPTHLTSTQELNSAVEMHKEDSNDTVDVNLSSSNINDIVNDTLDENKDLAVINFTDEELEIKKPSKRGRKRKKVEVVMKELDRPYKCSECPSSFQHASLLKRHSQKHSGQCAFPCSECDQSFHSKSELYRHQDQDHYSNVPIICKDCGKSFSAAKHLDEHRVRHTGEKPYACKTCGESFGYRTSLSRHRRKHRPSCFKCKDCGAEFYAKGDYKNHVNKHKSIKPNLCPNCGQSFSSASMLRQHLLRHGEKQFICELCGKAFLQKGEHKMHMMTHLSVKPFPCSLCGRSFVSRSKLRLHHSQFHLQLKPHRCPQCNAAFNNPTRLKDHISYAHTTERPFACHLCHSRFAVKRFYKLHLSRIHKIKYNPNIADQLPQTAV